MSHKETYLKSPKTNETVIYFAPTAEYNPIWKNDLFAKARPNGKPVMARDNNLWTGEFTLQGVFEDSDSPLPPEHEDALLALDSDWTAPVTARQQMNRLLYYLTRVGGPFYLIDGSDEYRATSASEVDVYNGVYPAVFPTEIRPPRKAGKTRVQFTVKFKMGVPSD